MSSGLLTLDARLRVFSDLGLVLPGAKLNTYAAGTSTPLQTFSDVALTTPNTNPIIASAGGLFGPIYVTLGVAYKYVLTDASNVTIWSQDNVMEPAPATVVTPPLVSLGLNDFRLTLESGVPVSSTDQLAATTIYATPSGRGNQIALYDNAGAPTVYASAQFSIAVPATTSQMYDVFVYNNAGVPTLELLAWTNDTTRATAIVLTTTGAYTKSGDLTRRYLGSVRTTTVSGQTEDSRVKRYLWNYGNRVPRPLQRIEATASWTYATATIRQANAAAANQVDVVVGVADTPIDLSLMAVASSSQNLGAGVGIGVNSTTVISTATTGGGGNFGGAGTIIFSSMVARLVQVPSVGRTFYAWLEYTSGATATFYGTPGALLAPTGTSCGLSGWISG